MLDDQSAVEQARQGDQHAWQVLYDTHADLVFRLAFRVVNDRDVAMDIVQEAYIKASRSIDRFRGDSTFRSWIASIALNEARSWVRKRSRAPQVSLEIAPEIADGARGADVVVADADLARRALAYIESLPGQQRDAVLLRTAEGLSYKEIAEQLGTTEGSVRVSYHHGISKVRSHMAQFVEARADPGRERTKGGPDLCGPSRRPSGSTRNHADH